MAKHIQFSINEPHVKRALALAAAADNSEVAQVRELVEGCVAGKLGPEVAGPYCIARAKAKAERGKLSGATYKAPKASAISGFKGVLNNSLQPWCMTFLARCEKNGVSFSFLRQMSTWAQKEYDATDPKSATFKAKKDGPSEKDIGKKLTALRKAAHGRGGATVPDAARKLANIIKAAKEYRTTFGDTDKCINSAIAALLGEEDRAKRLSETARKKRKGKK